MKKVLLFVFALYFSMPAQELQAVVTVNYQNLPVINKESLVNFAREIETYLNTTRFTGTEWKYDRIKCNFNISITTATDETNYSAQTVLVSQRQIYKSQSISPMLRVFDNNWVFTYEKNQPLYFNPLVFNSITSFLDYYAYMIIGMEQDSWEKLSGSEYFRKAFDVVNISSGTRYGKGWESTSGNYNRKDLVENLLSEKYRTVREALSDYHYGIDQAQRNRAAGQKKIAGFITTIKSLESKLDVRSVLIKTIFDSKHGEIVDYLRDYPDKEIFRVLKSIDPPHASRYDEVLNP
ncbi:MAG: DUF4835 family protein [Ignavibacteriaceae bacterium]|nr:DUF4835 family protein [Ignavibacteriaceae bacterium]